MDRTSGGQCPGRTWLSNGAVVAALLAAWAWRQYDRGLNTILDTIRTSPTLAEANKYVAGECKRVHAPKKLLEWVGRCHAWEGA